MAGPFKVVMKIHSVKGICEAKHHEGQEFDLSGEVTLGLTGSPKGICPVLYYAIFPNFRVLRFGGAFPWEEEGVAHVACPDPFNPVVAQLRRVKE